MAKKDGYVGGYNMTGILNIDDGNIVVEREDGSCRVIADDIKKFNGELVTINVSYEMPV